MKIIKDEKEIKSIDYGLIITFVDDNENKIYIHFNDNNLIIEQNKIWNSNFELMYISDSKNPNYNETTLCCIENFTLNFKNNDGKLSIFIADDRSKLLVKLNRKIFKLSKVNTLEINTAFDFDNNYIFKRCTGCFVSFIEIIKALFDELNKHNLINIDKLLDEN